METKIRYIISDAKLQELFAKTLKRFNDFHNGIWGENNKERLLGYLDSIKTLNLTKYWDEYRKSK